MSCAYRWSICQLVYALIFTKCVSYHPRVSLYCMPLYAENKSEGKSKQSKQLIKINCTY